MSDVSVKLNNEKDIIIVTPSESEKIIIQTEHKPVSVVVSGTGPRGEQGPPGLPGDAGYVLPIISPIVANKAVCVTQGYAEYANNAALDTQAIGFSREDGSPGYEITVTTSGEIDFGTDVFVPGEQQYLGENGEVINAPPTSGIVQKVGVALNEQILLISLSQPIILED